MADAQTKPLELKHYSYTYNSELKGSGAPVSGIKTWASSTLGYDEDLSRPSRKPSLPTQLDDNRLKSTTTSQQLLHDRLFSAWLERMENIFDNWDLNLLHSSIATSERYLLALQKSTDHRILIASVLNVLRFNDIDRPIQAQDLSKLLKEYKGKSIQRDETVSFVRKLREIGLTPSALGN